MKKSVIALLLASASLMAQAEVSVKDAWVRATVPQQKATGAFMTLTSNQDVRLVAAESSISGVTEVHEMKMEKDVMKMRAVDALELNQGKALELKPGGYHIMLMELKSQAKVGETVTLKLTFEGKDKKREVLEVKAPVKQITATEHKM
ncbi:MAG: copper chaperone PCu(A)C [Undibacterium curvum]|uniref:copper chaperone PCu(A)C n=1 Tax=Undibacterium curvum TaxID=2762294 RepID=UPI003BD00D36